jgi:hypothetical protein
VTGLVSRLHEVWSALVVALRITPGATQMQRSQQEVVHDFVYLEGCLDRRWHVDAWRELECLIVAVLRNTRKVLAYDRGKRYWTFQSYANQYVLKVASVPLNMNLSRL